MMHVSRHPASHRPGFTLIELTVVIGIMILLAAIAVPAVGPAMTSNHQMQMKTIFIAIIANARASGVDAIRIERAFKTDRGGYMIDRQGSRQDSGSFIGPVWLDYQQVRYLRYQKGTTNLEAIPGLDPVKLPTNVWLAPDYALTSLQTNPPVDTNDPRYFEPARAIADWTPIAPGPLANRAGLNPVPFSLLDNFYIAFDSSGSITTIKFNAFKHGLFESFNYYDQTQYHEISNQAAYPRVTHLQDSARGVIAYERSRLTALTDGPSRLQYLLAHGRPYFVNRFLGNVISGDAQ